MKKDEGFIFSKEDHPRGLNEEDRKEFHTLCERLFELYAKMPRGDTKAKVIAGCDEQHMDHFLVLFTGKKEDLFKIRELIGV